MYGRVCSLENVFIIVGVRVDLFYTTVLIPTLKDPIKKSLLTLSSSKQLPNTELLLVAAIAPPQIHFNTWQSAALHHDITSILLRCMPGHRCPTANRHDDTSYVIEFQPTQEEPRDT